MSEERGRRDGDTGGFAPGDAGTETGATPDASSSAARPSGKRAVRRSGAQASSSADAEGPRTRRSAVEAADRPAQQKPENIFKRLRRFLREVIAELRKVIWPNRKQLTTYSIVVVVFVAVMTALIFGLDLAFGQGVNWLFG
ncbi:preprotein translocase subunit SecE [Rhodococcus sp. NPDC060086]|uniref:preprotein translocase subunit SecE n=1 Tax=Rhodococcus sp. NPDC060086 TaxID=3347055 RepID=UPI00364F3FAB